MLFQEFGTDCIGKEKLYSIHSSYQTSLLNVSLAGITFPDNRYRIYKAADAYVFEYVCSGKGHISHQSKHYTVKAGDFYLLPRRINCFYYADNLNPFKKKWFNVSGTLVSSLLDLYDINKEEVFIKNIDVEGIFDNILSTISLPNKKDSSFAHNLLSLISLITDKEETIVNSTLAESISEFLDKNVESQLRLNDVARHFHISRAHLIHIFRETYKQTPYDYFLKQKIKLANEMIINTNMQIQEIATKLAFTDSHHFSTAFKKFNGISPKEYRNKHHKG